MGLEGGMTDRWVPLRVRKNALGNTDGGLAPKSGPSGLAETKGEDGLAVGWEGTGS